ncbi:MAG: LysR family transcriptional regulator, partial [Oscillospiraceae bacterium]
MEVTITNIIQLKYFVCVAASGSFSEAAELMFSTQSTVSKQIFSLEKDLNAQLFDRSKRKIVLTSQGKAVLRNAQIMLDDYNNMLSELAQLNAYDDSTVRIKSTPVLIPYNILTLLANFRKLNPWVKMQVEEFEEQDILKLLREDECDLAFIRVGKFDEELFERIVI